MKLKQSLPEKARVGDVFILKKYAWLPTKLTDGSWIVFEYYNSVWQFKYLYDYYDPTDKYYDWREIKRTVDFF